MVDTPSDDAIPSGHADDATPRRWPWLVLVLILVLIAIGARWSYLSLRDHDQRRADIEAENQALRARLETLAATLDKIREGQQRLSQRLDSANATNQVLREELLGMGERAGLLEDAVARLAQSRMSGESLLRLNEAEFLLSMGAERLALYGDAHTALSAYALAEGALAELDDPALATLRQTLTQEILQLRQMPADPRPPLRAELASLAAQVASLPASRAGEVALADADSSRIARLIGQLVTIRRVDPKAAPLGHAQRQAGLAAIALQFELAQAALAQPDAEAFGAALDRITQTAAALLDTQSAGYSAWAARLAAARDTSLLPTPPVLGATLRELRSLRAARGVGGAALHLPPPPAPTATPALERPTPAPAEPSDVEPSPSDEPAPAVEPVGAPR